MRQKRPLSVDNAITAQAVIAEAERRAKIAKSKIFDRTPVPLTAERLDFFTSRCHAKQQIFLKDNHRYKALMCPRGTGKTTVTMFETIMAAEKHPRSTIAYIVPDSKSHAKDLFWLPLKELNKLLVLNLKFNEVDKRVTHPNGTNILLLAAHDENSPTRLRGTPFSLVVLDECKDFGAHFETLIVEAVVPRLGDFDGTLVLAGTPGQVLEGLFYEVTSGKKKGWGVHVWTKADNTFLPEDERDLDKVHTLRYEPFGIGKDDPKFLREQKAMWIAEKSNRAYLYDTEKNGWDGELNPSIEYQYICGIDLGKRDATIFCVGAFSTYDVNLYYVELTSHHPLHLAQIADEYKRLNAAYSFVSVVVDTGGLGVMIVDDINYRFGFNWEPAEKKQKANIIEQMNTDFQIGRIKCHEYTPLAKEWLKLTKDPKTYLPRHTDIGDAALYTYRKSLHWTGAYVQPLPPKYSKEWYHATQDAEIAAAIKARQGPQEAYSDENI